MEKNKSKIFTKDIIFYVVAFVVLIIKFILPESGKYALLDEGFTVILVWFICTYIIMSIKKMEKAVNATQKILRVAVIIVSIVSSIWFPANVVMDIVNGTQQIHLYDTEVEKTQGRYGIISLHYYLVGKDEAGNKVRFEISGEDYSAFSDIDEVTVEYYKYTDRVIEIQ